MLLSAAASLAAAPLRAAPSLPSFRVGTLPSGTVQWELKTITDNGFDKAAGLAIEEVPLASNDAGRVAFLSGSIDAVVNDLLFAARIRADGQTIRYFPYSTNNGALMLPGNSPVHALADLAGKSIGVAGGPLDKNWLILRSVAEKQGIDLAKSARPVFGASPLLTAKLENGEIDAGLLYWNYCARLRAKGFREMTSINQLADQIGARGKIAFTGFLVKSATPLPVLQGFGKAIHQAEQHLATGPQAWQAVRPLMGAKDEATFDALKGAFVDGIPHKPLGTEVADARAFYATLAKLGGSALSGSASTLPDDLYVSEAVYG